MKPSPAGVALGVSPAAVSRWKDGAVPEGESLEKVARFFGCTVDYLLEGSGDRSGLETAEAELLYDYRRLDDHGKNLVRMVLDTALKALPPSGGTVPVFRAACGGGPAGIIKMRTEDAQRLLDAPGEDKI